MTGNMFPFENIHKHTKWLAPITLMWWYIPCYIYFLYIVQMHLNFCRGSSPYRLSYCTGCIKSNIWAIFCLIWLLFFILSVHIFFLISIDFAVNINCNTPPLKKRSHKEVPKRWDTCPHITQSVGSCTLLLLMFCHYFHLNILAADFVFPMLLSPISWMRFLR